MNIEAELAHHEAQVEDNRQVKQVLSPSRCFKEERYRWAIVVLMGCLLIVCAMCNNAIIPLQHKMTVVYGISQSYVSISIMGSFLVFSLMNFPANHIIDTHGLRLSFLLGSGLYTAGMALYTFINTNYLFVILGTVLLGAGQPFILNCPAKVAAFWFFPKNRAFATAIMIGINLFGMGIGFMIPTLVVNEDSMGDQAKAQIFGLYLGYCIAGFSLFILIFFAMRAKPRSPPSKGAEAEKLSPKQSLKLMRSDRNLWKFFIAYFLAYGTFVAFASNCNFIIKPYGYSDLQIAINAVILMVIGTIGAIAFSLYIKKTSNYKTAIRVVAVGSVIAMALLCTQLNTINAKALTTVMLSLIGIFLTPMIPLCYDLGCQISFPVGEAQVTGLLNGGAFLWAFIASLIVTNLIGFGNTKSSLIIMVTLFAFIVMGSILLFLVKMNLKRKKYEEEHQKLEEDSIEKRKSVKIQLQALQEDNKDGNTSTSYQSKSEKYSDFVEQTMPNDMII